MRCAVMANANLPSFPPLWTGQIYPHDRIRVAYISSDFREHPVAQLAAGLFERHDRSRFEVTAISLRAEEPESDLRRRLKSAFARFVEVQSKSDSEIAGLIRQLEIDIVIDLNGLTDGRRPNILAQRPAPVQVSYLGYAGTMGTPNIDYILADATVIPADQQLFYTEKVVWLPDSFMVTDAGLPVAERTPARAECGLPERGFVFCCFNGSYKIAPEVFEIWMRLLKATPGSVLWLNENNATAVANLRRHAEARDVAGDRIVIAPKVPFPEHLARHRQADLFLDTLPCNAHATAVDALRAELPVLTCPGAAFAGQVAASLLGAVGLPELITASPDDYEALALTLTRDPARLAGLKARLARQRPSCPLFDTGRFTRSIEAAYTTMWRRYQAGEAPAGFAVEPPGNLTAA
jgi:predicted O-linked N-acetylglucosamine transferase (SPINDLY family)